MDAGRRKALELLGEHGPWIRQQIPQLVNDEHQACLNAQGEWDRRSNRMYGNYWSGILELFEDFGRLPNASLVRPQNANYSVPVINGTALFPWRIDSSKKSELSDKKFDSSTSRVSLTQLPQPATQGALDLGLPELEGPDPGLTQDESQHLDAMRRSITDESNDAAVRLALVHICSSVHGVFSINWGEVKMNQNGFLSWVDTPESLLSLQPQRPVSTSSTRTFTSGAVPSKFPKVDKKKSTHSDE